MVLKFAFLVIRLAMNEIEIYKLSTTHGIHDTNLAEKKASSFLSLLKCMLPLKWGENILIDTRENKVKHQEYLREMVLNLILKCVLGLG